MSYNAFPCMRKSRQAGTTLLHFPPHMVIYTSTLHQNTKYAQYYIDKEDTLDYQIALSPDLGLDPANFVSAWNENADCRTIADARLAPSSSSHYDPFLLGAIAILSSVGLGVATNAIYDLIKQLFVKRGIQKCIKFTQLDQRDGTHLLVIQIEEESRQTHATHPHPGAPRRTQQYQRRPQLR